MEREQHGRRGDLGVRERSAAPSAPIWRAPARPRLLVDTDAAHVAALNANGLRITGPIEEFSANVRAVTPDQVKGPLRHVLLAVKGQHSNRRHADDRAAARPGRIRIVAARTVSTPRRSRPRSAPNAFYWRW